VPHLIITRERPPNIKKNSFIIKNLEYEKMDMKKEYDFFEMENNE
jgi:hypothetical protein